MSDLLPYGAPWTGRLIAIALAILGFALAAWALKRRRSDIPHCCQCRYNLTGLPLETRCPECGHVPSDPNQRYHTRRPHRWLIASLGLLIAFALPTFVMQRRVRVYGWEYYTYYGPFYWFSPTKVFLTDFVGEYDVTINRDRRWWNDTNMLLRISYRGRTLYEEWGYRWRSLPNLSSSNLVGGIELTGDGHPNLRVSEGGREDFRYLVFDLIDGQARIIAEIKGDKDHIFFRDLDSDGDYEITLRDETFARWNTMYAPFSSLPEVILGYNGTEYTPAIEMMRNPAPLTMELTTRAAALRNNTRIWVKGHTGYPLRTQMLDLIYTGHADLAFQFLNDAWPKDLPGRDAFKASFLNELQKSPYYAALIELNNGALPDPESN